MTVATFDPRFSRLDTAESLHRDLWSVWLRGTSGKPSQPAAGQRTHMETKVVPCPSCGEAVATAWIRGAKRCPPCKAQRDRDKKRELARALRGQGTAA
jgi:hypothetical protein